MSELQNLTSQAGSSASWLVGWISEPNYQHLWAAGRGQVWALESRVSSQAQSVGRPLTQNQGQEMKGSRSR